MELEPLRCINCGKRIPKTRFEPICACTGSQIIEPSMFSCIHLGEKHGKACCGCAGDYPVFWCKLQQGHCTLRSPGKSWNKVGTNAGNVQRVARLEPCLHCSHRALIEVQDLGQQPTINNYIAVTALSPRKHSVERQLKCLETWKRFGLKIAVRNTRDESKELKNRFSMVDHWLDCDDTTTDYNYPTQRILNLAKVSRELDIPVLVINSDIELYGSQDLIRFDEQSQFIGIRWNYSERPQMATEFQWGLDAFTFTPKQADLLPDDFPYGIGQAMWDYAVPAIMRHHGINLNFVHKPFLFHKDHNQNWSHEGWHFGARWLADRYGVKIEYESSSFRNSLEPNFAYRNGRYQIEVDVGKSLLKRAEDSQAKVS